jgi:uncharacterized protein YndB with AHSA1/START domain
MDEPQIRYADGPGVQVETAISADPAKVWALVTDVDLPAWFSDEFLGADWLDGATHPALGARFVGRNRHPAVGEWQTTSTVTEYVPEAAFTWAVGEPEHPSATWWFTLQRRPGGVQLGFGMRMGPARSGINPAIDAMPDKESRILQRRLAEHRTNMEATLAGIKARAEGPPLDPA